MKNLPKEKRDRLIMAGVGTLVAVLAIYYLLVRSQQSTATELAKKIGEQKAKVSNAERLVAATEDLKKHLNLEAKKVTGIEDTMASGDMYAWVIQTVGRFGAERNVDIPQFSREVATEVGVFPKFPYKAVMFNLRGTAYYHDLGKFLADFENKFPYARIQNLEMEPAGGSAATSTPDPEKLAFRLELVTLINPNIH